LYPIIYSQLDQVQSSHIIMSPAIVLSIHTALFQKLGNDPSVDPHCSEVPSLEIQSIYDRRKVLVLISTRYN